MTRPTTDVFDVIDLEPRMTEVDRLLKRGNAATIATAVFLIAAVVVAGVMIRDLWPPRATSSVTVGN